MVSRPCGRGCPDVRAGVEKWVRQPPVRARMPRLFATRTNVNSGRPTCGRCCLAVGTCAEKLTLRSSVQARMLLYVRQRLSYPLRRPTCGSRRPSGRIIRSGHDLAVTCAGAGAPSWQDEKEHSVKQRCSGTYCAGSIDSGAMCSAMGTDNTSRSGCLPQSAVFAVCRKTGITVLLEEKHDTPFSLSQLAGSGLLEE